MGMRWRELKKLSTLVLFMVLNCSALNSLTSHQIKVSSLAVCALVSTSSGNTSLDLYVCSPHRTFLKSQSSFSHFVLAFWPP